MIGGFIKFYCLISAWPYTMNNSIMQFAGIFGPYWMIGGFIESYCLINNWSFGSYWPSTPPTYVGTCILYWTVDWNHYAHPAPGHAYNQPYWDIALEKERERRIACLCLSNQPFWMYLICGGYWISAEFGPTWSQWACPLPHYLHMLNCIMVQLELTSQIEIIIIPPVCVCV